jgi:hypothetical protein
LVLAILILVFPTPNIEPGPPLYVINILSLDVLISLVLALSSLWLNRTANIGWDFKIYEKAVNDYNSGINPYINK